MEIKIFLNCQLIGNFLIIVAVIITKKLRIPTNYIIVNLAISDIGLSIGLGLFAVFGNTFK